MDPHVKEVWLNALRSGEYTQIRGNLHNEGGGFCCLGVLCDLSLAATWTSNPDVVRIGLEPCASRYSDCICLPPRLVYEWAGLDPDAAGALANLNDNGWTFDHLADWIEKNL